MAGANTLEFTDDNFDSEVLQSDKPVLVDFWAEWCMPCRALGPTIDEIATEYADKAKVGKLNTENSMSTGAKYGVQAIPTILVFKGGKVVQKFVGVTGKKDLAAAIDSALG
ncbi:MAG: thioredoxin [Phycisphaerales bacterium]|nr:thioredoxin [Phycisphaerales bacterium]